MCAGADQHLFEWTLQQSEWPSIDELLFGRRIDPNTPDIVDDSELPLLIDWSDYARDHGFTVYRDALSLAHQYDRFAVVDGDVLMLPGLIQSRNIMNSFNLAGPWVCECALCSSRQESGEGRSRIISFCFPEHHLIADHREFQFWIYDRDDRQGF